MIDGRGGARAEEATPDARPGPKVTPLEARIFDVLAASPTALPKDIAQVLDVPVFLVEYRLVRFARVVGLVWTGVEP